MLPEPVIERDPRVEFLADYTCKTLRLKPEKWTRMLVSDEQRTILNNFIDRDKPQVRKHPLFVSQKQF